MRMIILFHLIFISKLQEIVFTIKKLMDQHQLFRSLNQGFETTADYNFLFNFFIRGL